MILADLIDEFPDSIRRRGADYHRMGAVRLTPGRPDSVTAMVSGTRRYNVGIEVCNRRLLLFCSCPFFDSDGPCKHLWATVLAADKAGVLRPLPDFDEIVDGAGGGTRAADAEAPEREDDDAATEDDGEDDDDDLGNDEDEPPSRISALAAPGSRPRDGMAAPYRRGSAAHAGPLPAWKDFLQRARAASPPRAAVPSRFVGELLYVVDVEKTLASAGLTLLLLGRSRKKNGEWTKLKAPSVPLGALGSLADERDRRALPLLQGAAALSDGGSAYGYSYASAYGSYQRCFSTQARLPVSMADMVMPLLSETGRLFVRRGPEDEPVPAHYDGGDPWQLVLRLGADDEGSGTDLTGALRRGVETLALTQPHVLTNEGWVVFPDRIARFEHFGSFGLVSLLRERSRVPIPAR